MSTEREDRMELDAARYVDGAMDAPERRGFEARMGESQSLRAEVEVMRRADESLRRSFGALGPIELESRHAGAGRGLQVRPWMLLGAVAAAAVIVLAALPLLVQTPAPRRGVGVTPKSMTGQEVYALEASRGWKIDHVCADAREFAAYSFGKVGEALIADAAAVPGLEIAGWTGYDLDLRPAGVGARSCLIVARVDGRPVLVVLDPGGEQKQLRTDAGGGAGTDLRTFRRQVGSVTLYEVTPLDEPRVIGVFEEAPAEWRDDPGGSPGH